MVTQKEPTEFTEKVPSPPPYIIPAAFLLPKGILGPTLVVSTTTNRPTLMNAYGQAWSHTAVNTSTHQHNQNQNTHTHTERQDRAVQFTE